VPSLTAIVRAPAPADALSGSQPGSGHTSTAQAYDAGLLVLRLVIGLLMAAHGAQKLFGLFGGSGVDGTAKGFAALGYPAAHFQAILAGLCEGLGGLGLAVGFLTPLAAAAVIGDMLNATVSDWHSGFFAPKGSVELALLYLVAAVGLALTGPGGYALDRFVPPLRVHRLAYGAIAVAVAAGSGVFVLLLRH
jgi:putative oxidoreductase